MTQFTKKSFTVPSWKAPKECNHGWVNQKTGKCIKCGEYVQKETIARKSNDR